LAAIFFLCIFFGAIALPSITRFACVVAVNSVDNHAFCHEKHENCQWLPEAIVMARASRSGCESSKKAIGVERLRDAPAEWSQQFEALGLKPR
jgi:hypothetical protein